MRLALFEPEIPQNTGTLLRLGACMNVPLDIIEPCGFVFSNQRMRRAGMDYVEQAQYQRHPSWDHFQSAFPGCRRILLTPHTDVRFMDFEFAPDDILLLGRESNGVPPDVAQATDAQITIPMVAGCRSLNVAIAAAMVLSEALRQTRLFPGAPHVSL